MRNLQKGFIVPIILALIALLLVGGGAYVYLQKKQENPPVTGNAALPQTTSTIPTTKQTTSTTQTLNSQTADWKTYRDEKFGFEIKYPPEFNTSHGGGYASPDNNWARVSFKKSPLNLVFFTGTRPTSGGCGEGFQNIWSKKILIDNKEARESLEYYDDNGGSYCWEVWGTKYTENQRYDNFATDGGLKTMQEVNKFVPQLEAIAKTLHYIK